MHESRSAQHFKRGKQAPGWLTMRPTFAKIRLKLEPATLSYSLTCFAAEALHRNAQGMTHFEALLSPMAELFATVP